MLMPAPSQQFLQPPTPEQRADIRLAASKMTGATRRSFEAAMTLKYCGGDARQAENVFGWGRHTVALGLAERHTGILCLGAQSACSGRKRWEDEHPQVAEALCHLPSLTPTRPAFRTIGLYASDGPRGPAVLRTQGYDISHLPASRTSPPADPPGFCYAKWSKPNPKRRSQRPMPSSTT